MPAASWSFPDEVPTAAAAQLFTSGHGLHPLSGERTADVVTKSTKCCWQTSVSFLLEA